MDNPNKVTIVGTGVQGSMLAFRFAAYGRDVTLYDLKMEACKSALGKIKKWMDQYVAQRKLMAAQAEKAMSAIRVSDNLSESLKDCDVVIENVPERIELKQRVWNDIDRYAPPKTLLTTNSSSLRSSEIGKDVIRKDKTFNMNFAMPVEDDLVEVMWNSNTSEATKTKVLALLESAKLIPIITKKEIKGFSVNRIWRAMKKESLKLWAEGYIDPETLDKGFVMEWHTAYGPFGLMDKVGLDVVRDIEMSYYRESGDPSDIPPKALDEMIEKGYLGEKTGKGFYEYPKP